MTKESDNSEIWIIIGFIILVFVVILFLISVGKIDLFEKTKESKGVNEDRNNILKQVEDLKSKLEQKAELKNLIEKKSLRTYNWAKCITALAYIVINIIVFNGLWTGNFTETLGYLLNYNQVFFILFFIIAIVIPRKPANIFTLNYYLRLRIKTIYYSRTPLLEEEIRRINSELEKLTSRHLRLREF